MTAILDRLHQALVLGGWVVGVILALSVVALAVILWKLWQFHAFGHCRHASIDRGLAAWDAGDAAAAQAALAISRNRLAPVLAHAMAQGGDPGLKSRFEAEAETRLLPLEQGFRLLDLIAQVAPLLGLFGTVLGMIDAFRALQSAGAQVDPSLLAGGIWVALLTTAAGLAVAMPVSAILTLFEARADRERAFAAAALEVIFHPLGRRDAAAA